MKKYLNKRFKNNIIDIIACIVFAILVLVSFYFYGEWMRVKALANIGKTQIDYIVQAPSKEQVDLFNNKQFVEHVVPYVYRNVIITSPNGNVTTNLFVIEDISDARYTMFSDQLLLKKTDESSDSIIYISEEFSRSAKISVGDSIAINVDGGKIDCIVDRIYESDHRYVGGSILLFMNQEVEAVLLGDKDTIRYSGAFISCNDSNAGYDYFVNEYMPEGDLRDKSEFDSEEAYLLYMEQRNQKDSSMSSFVTGDYLKEIERRNSAKLSRLLLYWILADLFGIFVIAITFTSKSLTYIKKNVLLDIKDNYSYEQEANMIIRYYIFNGIYSILFFAVSFILAVILKWITINGIMNYIPLVGGIIAICITCMITKRKMNKEYYVQKEKYIKLLKTNGDNKLNA